MDKFKGEMPQITLRINNESPLNVRNVGALFTALSNDYAKLDKSRSLSIISMKNGSLIITLTDGALTALPYLLGTVGVIAAANTLLDFFQKMKGIIRAAKDDPSRNDVFRKKRKTGIRSVERIVETAIKSGANIKLSYRGGDGEELSISVSTHEATKIRQVAETDQNKAISNIKKLVLKPQALKSTSQIDRTVEHISTMADNRDASQLVKLLINILEENAQLEMIETLVIRLDQAGLHKLALDVRNHGADRRQDTPRPIGT